MLGSSSDPTAIASVLLTPKPGGAAEGQPGASTVSYQQSAQTMAPAPGGRMFPQGPFRQQVNANGSAQPQADAAASDDSADDAADDKEEEAADQAQQAQPAAAQPDANQQDQQANNPNQPNAGPRTPEQILQMLRQAQQPPNAMSGQQPNGQQPANPPQQ
jgi:hypothetical protein